jgi:hypothetical protein
LIAAITIPSFLLGASSYGSKAIKRIAGVYSALVQLALLACLWASLVEVLRFIRSRLQQECRARQWLLPSNMIHNASGTHHCGTTFHGVFGLYLWEPEVRSCWLVQHCGSWTTFALGSLLVEASFILTSK